MTVSYPLADIFETLKAQKVSFELSWGQEFTGLPNGLLVAKDLRPALWRLSATSKPMRHKDAMIVYAKLNSLYGIIKTFLASNPLAPYPYNDPTGSTVGSSAVKINAFSIASGTVQFKGLPASYALKAGDLFSFVYSSTKIALHQLVEDVTANGSGVTGSVEVRPALRSGVAIDNVVTLKKPYAEFRMVPDSVSLDAVNTLFSTVSFEAVQRIA